MNTFHGYDESVLESLDELGCAGDGCGTLTKFDLTLTDGVISNARWWAREIGGPGEAHALAARLSEAVLGMNLHEATKLGASHFGLDRTPAALVAEDAFHHALGVRVIHLMRDGVTEPSREGSVLVAMSGGVDSAVTLHRAERAAHGDVIGCTLRLWIDPAGPDPDRACCAPDSVRRARHTCHDLGRGHLSLDMRAKFQEIIVKPFVEGYAAGETPNPCVNCNGDFRLDELVSAADVLGFDRVATGHYAQTVVRGGVTLVKRGVDENKDQSYMLSRVSPEIMARYWFPLGHQTKPEVRAEAAALGLVQAKIPGSQEICFLGGGDYRNFLSRNGGMGKHGNIVDRMGNILGTHDGAAKFTAGQRKGLDVQIMRDGQTTPAYVLEVKPDGTVIIGTRDELGEPTIRVRALRSHVELPDHVVVQPRYGKRSILSGRITSRDDRNITITLDGDLTSAVAPGQTCAVYDTDGAVLASGFIAR